MAVKKIYKVTSVSAKLKLVVTPGPLPVISLKLAVNAKGLVRTAGWSNGKLVPHIYVMAPPDGIQGFDFVANAPTGLVPQIILPITAKEYVGPHPSWMKGVRVYSETNNIKAMITGPLFAQSQRALALHAKSAKAAKKDPPKKNVKKAPPKKKSPPPPKKKK